MNVSKEMLEKAKTAKNAAELQKMAEDENLNLTEEEAEKAFSELHHSGELSDDELDNVSGGCGDPIPPKPKFKLGERVRINHGFEANVTQIIWRDDQFVYDVWYAEPHNGVQTGTFEDGQLSRV